MKFHIKNDRSTLRYKICKLVLTQFRDSVVYRGVPSELPLVSRNRSALVVFYFTFANNFTTVVAAVKLQRELYVRAEHIAEFLEVRRREVRICSVTAVDVLVNTMNIQRQCVEKLRLQHLQLI